MAEFAKIPCSSLFNREFGRPAPRDGFAADCLHSQPYVIVIEGFFGTRHGFELGPKLPGLTPDALFRRGLLRPVRSGKRVAHIAIVSYAGFGGTAKGAMARHRRPECGSVSRGKTGRPAPDHRGAAVGQQPNPWFRRSRAARAARPRGLVRLTPIRLNL